VAVRDENCNLGPEPVQDRGLALGHLGQELVIGAEGAQSVDEHFKPRTSTSTLGETRSPGLADLFVATMKGSYA
jgi:hypothetical protein